MTLSPGIVGGRDLHIQCSCPGRGRCRGCRRGGRRSRSRSAEDKNQNHIKPRSIKSIMLMYMIWLAALYVYYLH